MTVVTQGISVKLLPVMKHLCTTMNLREKHRTEQGCLKEKTHLQLWKEIDLRRRNCTVCLSIIVELCYKNLVKRERASLQNTTESVCLLLSAIFTRECNRTLACMVSNFFTITHFAYKCKLLQGYLVDEILTLCLTLPSPLTLRTCDILLFLHLKKCLVTFFLFPQLKKMSSWAKIQLKVIPQINNFQCLSHIIYSQDRVKRAFLQWVGRLWRCVAAGRGYSEKLQWKKPFCSEGTTLYSMY